MIRLQRSSSGFTARGEGGEGLEVWGEVEKWRECKKVLPPTTVVQTPASLYHQTYKWWDVPIKLSSGASLLAKVSEVGGEWNLRITTQEPFTEEEEEERKVEWQGSVVGEPGQEERSVLPLEAERRECGASGHLGPWGPAGLRNKPRLLQNTVRAEQGRCIMFLIIWRK